MNNVLKLNDIENYQKKILIHIKKYILKLKKEKLNISKSILCYFGSWDETPGILNIKNKIHNHKLKFLICLLKNIIGIGFQSSYCHHYKKLNSSSKNVILTWGYKKSFDRYGNFYDSYLKINSKTKHQTLWLIVYMDKFLPEKISDNILIIHNKNNFFNPFYFLKIIIFNLFKYKLNLRKFFHFTSSSTNFGEIFIDKIKNIQKFENVQKIYMPYESQIFQNMFIDYIRKKIHKAKTFGYVHDFEPVTPNLFHNTFSPDYLFLPGKGRKRYFTKFLGWPKKKIITTFSMRYSSKDVSDLFKNKVLLPSGIYDEAKILKTFENLILKESNLTNYISVRKHPKSTSQKKQSSIEKKMNTIISYNKNLYNKKKIKNKISIVVGITSLTILLLKKNYRILHLAMEPELQVYTKLFWPEIKVNYISENIFEYTLKEKNIFSFRKKKNLNKYLNLC